MSQPETLSPTSAEFFESKYTAAVDPWNFAHSGYEQARYHAIMQLLGERPYRRAFEPGCSIGELTWRLAERCGHLEALDISSTAAARARERCRQYPNVDVRVGTLPQQIPTGPFDLIVFSEIGYYFDRAALQELAKTLVDHLCPSGVLLAAHWLGTSQDHVLGGDEVHEIIGGIGELQLQASERHTNFHIDRWIRR